MLQTINQYAPLINVTLLISIIGILIHLMRLTRTSLQDKHAAELAARDAHVSALEDRLVSKDEQHQTKLDVLNHQLGYFQKIADLPDDKRVEAIRHDYEHRLKQLADFESNMELELKEKEALREELQALRKEGDEFFKVDKSVLSKALEMLPHLVRITGGF